MNASLSAPFCRLQQQYAVKKKMGSGVYSAVYDAASMATGERCVIKVLKPIKTKRVRMTADVSCVDTMSLEQVRRSS